MSEDYRRHILFRHPEIIRYGYDILDIVAKPDEVYEDERGGIHSLKRIDKSHFFVVMHEFERDDEGFIRTAYVIS